MRSTGPSTGNQTKCGRLRYEERRRVPSSQATGAPTNGATVPNTAGIRSEGRETRENTIEQTGVSAEDRTLPRVAFAPVPGIETLSPTPRGVDDRQGGSLTPLQLDTPPREIINTRPHPEMRTQYRLGRPPPPLSFPSPRRESSSPAVPVTSTPPRPSRSPAVGNPLIGEMQTTEISEQGKVPTFRSLSSIQRELNQIPRRGDEGNAVVGIGGGEISDDDDIQDIQGQSTRRLSRPPDTDVISASPRSELDNDEFELPDIPVPERRCANGLQCRFASRNLNTMFNEPGSITGKCRTCLHALHDLCGGGEDGAMICNICSKLRDT